MLIEKSNIKGIIIRVYNNQIIIIKWHLNLRTILTITKGKGTGFKIGIRE
jgi:hypothetical protein